MARQSALLQASERMRTLRWALGSVDDSISFSDDQELHEAFNQVEAGVKTLGKAIIKIAEATRFVDDSDEEPQQQQAELAFPDSSADTAIAAERQLLKLDAERQRLQTQLIVLRAHRAQVIFLTVAQTLLSLPPTTADDAAATPPPPPALLPADPYSEKLPPPRTPISRVSSGGSADPVVALTTAEDAAATPPPPPALLPADPAFRGRSRSPIGRLSQRSCSAVEALSLMRTAEAQRR